MAELGGAVVQVLVQNLISMLSGEIKLVRGFKDDLKKLQDALITTQEFLSDAEEKEIKDKAAKKWLKELENVAFEADDVLDKINYHLLQKKLKNIKRQKEKVSSSSSSGSLSLLFRIKMARKINDLNQNFATINKDAVSHGLKKEVVSAPNASAIGIVETDSFSVEPNVVGRENDVSNVVEMVVNAPLDEKISVIPIVGMGGLGKTTLAHRVFHDEKIKDLFKKRIWICVSFDFDEVTLLRTILKTLTGEDVQGIVTAEVVLQKIHAGMECKRYLIILDDIWNKEFKKWDNFMNSMRGITNVKQNVIVVTTREENVASLVKTLPRYKLMCLSKDDCWSIIKGKALLHSDNTLEYEEIGKCIAQKSGGLPLAANVIGGLLRGKPKEEWSSILLNELSNFGKGENRLMRILKLSYNRLPSSSLKRCFAYFSVFPQDSEIKKEIIIEQWLAEGFLQTNQENDHLEIVGNKIFNHLLQASLIQESKRDNFGNITHCRMHDLLHDLACLAFGGRSDILKDNMSKVPYLYLQSHEQHQISKERANCMRTLIFDGEVADNIFPLYSRLRVLKLTNSSIQELPIKIMKQIHIHMRFLDISSTKITKLSDIINTLSNLQTLVATNLQNLPVTIIDLLNLRHLHISAIELPPFIGKLTSLRTLPYYKVGNDRGCRIGELENLKNLKGSLEIQNLERVKDKEEAEHADLFGKSTILMLVLVWGSLSALNRNDENVLEGLQPHPNLQSLKVCGYESDNFPSWTMKMTVYNVVEGRYAVLSNLIEICIVDCQCEKIPNLGHLPCLKFLELKNLPAVQSIGLSFYGLEDCSTSNMIVEVNIPKKTTVFPALKNLHLTEMRNLKEWADAESRVATFPFLEYLDIRICPQLESAPTRFPILKELKIEVIGCNVSLTSICTNTSSLQTLEISTYSGIVNLGDECFVKNRDLSLLEIYNCPNIKGTKQSPELEQDSGTLHGLQSLKDFRIYDCPELKSIPDFDLRSLRRLSIENCPALTCFPGELLEFCIPSIERLHLWDLPNVENMETLMSCISRMSNLENLSLVKLPKLKSLPTEIGCLRNLWGLEIGGFSKSLDVVSFNDYLKRVLHESHCLEYLTLYGNEDWGSLPNHIQHLHSLEHLHIHNHGIDALPEWIENLSSLQELLIMDCKNLHHLPSKKFMQHITELQIWECPLLTERIEIHQDSTPGAVDDSE